MENKRRHDRYRCMAYCGIYDITNENQLGILIDLSQSGLRVMGEAKLRSGRIYNIRLELPKRVNDSKIIYVSAKCSWSNKSEEPNLFISGFEFEDVNDQTKRQIDANLHSSVFKLIED